jgi:rare lipoprotein A
MRTRSFAVFGSVFLGMGMLVFTPSANPTAVGRMSNPPEPEIPTPIYSPSSAKSFPAKPQPLAVWDCISSWYGDDFDGQPTANGEIYDMNSLTAAHPTLPLGSIVRVTNTRNHRSTVVRINDRGPYVEGRELDVSYEVARRLGFDQRGTAKVRMELLEVPSRHTLAHQN